MKVRLLASLVLFISVALLSGCSKKPESVVKSYLETKSWAEKKDFVLDSEGIEKEPEIVSSKWSFKEIEGVNPINVPGYSEVSVVFEKKDGDKQTIPFLIKETEDGYKIDLKATAGFNKQGIIEYGIKLPQEPTKFRALIQYDNATTEVYMKPGIKAISVFTNEDMGSSQAFTITAKTNNPKDKELLDLISDGKSHKVMLELSKPFKYNGLNLVLDYKILSQDWIDRKNI